MSSSHLTGSTKARPAPQLEPPCYCRNGRMCSQLLQTTRPKGSSGKKSELTFELRDEIKLAAQDIFYYLTVAIV